MRVISYESNYRTVPKSRKDIRNIAKALRDELGIPQGQLYVDITKVLELMCDAEPAFSFEVVDDNVIEKNVQAQSDIDKHTIFIKESVYIGAIHNCGRDRMSIAHEIFHILLHQRNTLVLYSREEGTLKRYENPEWQAECFAGEFLMPYSQIKTMDKDDIINKCKVSERAANYQLTHI